MKPLHLTRLLTAAFCLLIAVLAIVGWRGISHLSELNTQMQNIVGDQWKEVQLTHEAFHLSELNSQITLTVFFLDDQNEIQPLLAEREANTQRISELISKLEPRLDPQESRLFAAVKATRTPYVESYKKALSLLLTEHNPVEARKMMVDVVRPNLTAYHDAWNTFDQHETDQIDQTIPQSKAYYIAGEREFLVTVVLAELITCAIAIFTVIRLGHETAVRYRAEQVSQQANALLRAEMIEHERTAGQLDRIFAVSPDVIFTKGFDGYLQHFNPALERILGCSKSELLAEPFINFAHPDDRIAVNDAMSRTLEDGRISEFEARYRCKDGSYKWIEWNVVAVRKEHLFNGTGRDITERKLAEEKMERLRNEHMIILNSVSEGVHWIDTAGNIKFENPSAATMLGYEAGELIGKPGHQTIHHSHADNAPYPVSECPIYATLRDGMTRRANDEVFWRKDGTSFPVEYTSTPVRNENGILTGTVVVFVDITDRNRIEARMFQSQKMETVGKLAGGVAHEFNSILTAIIGQSELLLSDLPPDDPVGKNAREIRQAADRAATLTRQLLAYGRKQILQPEILDLDRILADMVSTLQHLMGREVDVRIVPSVGLKTVKIDPGQMEQVIVNMAMNAADAMPNGGQFTLETSNVTLDEEYVRPFPGLKAGDYVMLAITDTGTGMSENVKARAFEPFFSTKGVGQGTGLGLATCYGIIKQSEGHINLYSEVARGTTFKIYLPQVRKQTTTPLPRLKSPDLPRGTETILMAEDDPSLLEMSATLLRRLGYTVLTAANGLEALNLKNQKDIGHIDLLFTDIVMPHMSGKELSDRIRAIYPGTKILFTSAYTESAIVHQGILNEGVILLQKPFTPSALANKVREVLDQ